MTQLQAASTEGAPRIIYLSFAATGAYPASNVAIQSIELQGRDVVEKAFGQLFEEAALVSPQEKRTFHLRQAHSGTSVSKNVTMLERMSSLFWMKFRSFSQNAHPKKLTFSDAFAKLRKRTWQSTQNRSSYCCRHIPR